MGLFNKGASKNDVKLAKIELEKIKLEEKKLKKMSKEEKEEYKRKQMQEEVNGYLEYTKLNFERICSIVNDLKEDTISLIQKIKSYEGRKLGFKEKGELRKNSEKAKDNLRYLYLIKDYFVAVTKLSTALPLKLEQCYLIIKFGPYFDGTPVLDLDDDDYDESNMGVFKMIGETFKEAFIGGSSQSTFDFNSYLYERYNDQIEAYKVPDVDSVIVTFKNSIISKTSSDNFATNSIVGHVESNDFIECPNCKAKVNKDAKFCPECGTKIKINKTTFCSECGNPITPGTKFCPNCGHKI